MTEPSAEAKATFKGLLTEFMAEYEKLPADVKAKMEAAEAAHGDKPMTEAPDHLKSLELHAKCDVNGDGLLDLSEWREFCKCQDEHSTATYGGFVAQSEEA